MGPFNNTAVDNAGNCLAKTGSVAKEVLTLKRNMSIIINSGKERVIPGCTEFPFALGRLGSDLSNYTIDILE